MIRPAALALAACCAFTSAHASIGEPYDEFVSRNATDVPLAHYDQGTLGVVLPGYARVYLYPAWRAIVLGRDGLAAHPSTPGGLKAAVGSQVDGWGTVGKGPFESWAAASAAYAQRPAPAGKPQPRSQWRGEFYGYTYLNCPDGAFEFAASNLAALARRNDAQPTRLRDWVAAQDQVFAFCDYDPKAKPMPNRPVRPKPELPQPLAAAEPLYWQQMRDYQVASAQFYDEAYAQALQGFDRIAATPGHPMQAWGAYLALRTQVRTITQQEGQPNGPAKLAPVLARADRILADPKLAAVHEPTRAIVRIARFRFTPAERLEALSAMLDDVERNPYRDSALGDWRRLAAESMEFASKDRVDEAPLRQRHAFFDWMRTLQRCEFDVGTTPVAENCPRERAHALERWQAATGGEKRAWMVAALTLADTMPPALESAALQVQPGAPEYVTVRYHLARLYRLAKKTEKAREVSDAALKSQDLAQAQSDSARFLLQQERFASAASRDDAVAFLQRRQLWQRDQDTGEAVPQKNPDARLAADGLGWLNTRLAVSDLLAVGRDERLDAKVRAGITVAAWMRADLLGQSAQAMQAATTMQQFAGLKDAADRYLAADAKERRHVLVVDALKQQLSPEVRAFQSLLEPVKPVAESEDQPTASMWCRIGLPAAPEEDPWGSRVEQVPPPPDLSLDPAARDRELAALGKLKTATGFIGDHTLARVRTHPRDPDLPWLLHVVVWSTKGGCVDKDNRQLSRTAWQLLHSRYPDSVWAKKAPYWY